MIRKLLAKLFRKKTTSKFHSEQYLALYLRRYNLDLEASFYREPKRFGFVTKARQHKAFCAERASPCPVDRDVTKQLF